MKKNPRVSYIIITLNRGQFLINTIKDVLAQNYHPFEIIIVDQSKQIDPALTKLVSQHKPTIKYIYVPWQHQTRARNLGAQKATGDLFIYVDDDVHIEPNFTTCHIDAYGVNPQIGGVTGAVITPHDANPIGGGFITWLGGVRLNRGATQAGYVDAAFGCNMSFRRSVWEEVGGFCEIVMPSNLEETYFSMKVKRAGYLQYYEPKAVTLHFISPSGGTRNISYSKRIAWYYPFFFNQFYFFLSFFPHVLLPLFILSKSRPILACMFYYGRGTRDGLLTPWRALSQAWKEAHSV